MKEFLIGSWISCFDYKTMRLEEQIKRLAALGLNYLPFPFAWYFPETHDDLEDWREIDRLCNRYGVYYGMTTAADKRGVTQEAFEKNISYAKEMSDRLIVYHLTDEPEGNRLSFLGEWVKRYAAADKRVKPIFNLFPSYATARMLGNSFEGYLQAAIDEVGRENMCFLSHDYYPFREDGSTRYMMLADAEDMRKVAYRNGKISTHAFLQANAWRGWRMPRIEEMRWQAYTYIAYGCKALSYFNFVSPNAENPEGYTDGLIMQDGSVPDPERLEKVGKLNFALRAVGNELLDTQTLYAYHTQLLCEHTELLPENFPVQPLDRTRPFLITQHDRSDLFMIVNDSFEWGGEAEFRIDGAKELKLFSPEKKEYVPCDYREGILKVHFEKGEGLLFERS